MHGNTWATIFFSLGLQLDWWFLKWNDVEWFILLILYFSTFIMNGMEYLQIFKKYIKKNIHKHFSIILIMNEWNEFFFHFQTSFIHLIYLFNSIYSISSFILRFMETGHRFYDQIFHACIFFLAGKYHRLPFCYRQVASLISQLLFSCSFFLWKGLHILLILFPIIVSY